MRACVGVCIHALLAQQRETVVYRSATYLRLSAVGSVCGGVCCCFIFCLLFYAELCKAVLITIITISIITIKL